jgi:hypothetical protein
MARQGSTPIFSDHLLAILLVLTLVEFITLRTLQRLYTPLATVGNLALITGFVVALVLFPLIGYGSGSKVAFYLSLLVMALILATSIAAYLRVSPFLSIVSLIYYLSLPAYALLVYLNLIKRGAHSLSFRSGLALAPLALIALSYNYLSAIAASYYGVSLPGVVSLATLGVYVATLLPLLLGVILLAAAVRQGYRRVLVSGGVATLVVGPVVAMGVIRRKLANYLALYVIEAFGIPLPLVLTPLFFSALLVATAGVLAIRGDTTSNRRVKLGLALLLLGGYQLNIAYYPLVWLIGLSTLCLLDRS